MLDLDAIRRRWAATPWTNGRSPELADDIAALLSELDRLTAALAAAQPVVEWRHLPGSAGWERADAGQFSLLLMGDSAWRLICGDQAVIARGSPGGPAGKAACEAAYRRACGLPAIPPCAG